MKWLDGDLDTVKFEEGEAPGDAGKDWGLALSGTVLWAMEELAIEGEIVLQPESPQASFWFLGASSTCELRWLQPKILLSRLPALSQLELVLIGFLGELDPDNKRLPDPKADHLRDIVLPDVLPGSEGSEDRRAEVRIVMGTLQQALEKMAKSKSSTAAPAAAEPAQGSEETTAADDSTSGAAAASSTPTATDDAAAGPAAEDGSTTGAPAAESAAEGGEAAAEAAKQLAAAVAALAPPQVCFIAHPQLHRYFTDFYPAMAWLIQRNVPTVIIGASEPDLSWKQDEVLLRALGANLVVSKRLSPYPMCLPDNATVRKCNHIIAFRGGKALERDKLTRAKIDLIAQDYTVR